MTEVPTPTGVSALDRLREPFAEHQLRHRPAVTCRTCADPALECVEHERKVCETCRQLVSTEHEHVEYVSHVEVTERLLEADPLWYWEPFALTPAGLPAFDANGGLFIRLHLHDVDGFALRDRIGYGDSMGLPGTDGVKAAISDAIKNAAGRFGVKTEPNLRRDFEMVPGKPGLPATSEGSDDPRAPLWETIRTLSGYAGRFENAEIAAHFERVNADRPDAADRSINTAAASVLMFHIGMIAHATAGIADGGSDA